MFSVSSKQETQSLRVFNGSLRDDFRLNVAVRLLVLLVFLSIWLNNSMSLIVAAKEKLPNGKDSLRENAIESGRNGSIKRTHHAPCGTIATNSTHIVVKNPNHPEAIYTKSICEIVIERANPPLNKITINFKQLELYRPTADGSCLQDRFGLFTDLNAPISPIICGNYTGKTMTIQLPVQSSVIASIRTSNLDHDRNWLIEIQQER